MKLEIGETEWFTARSLFPVCTAVETRANARKMRLFGCACCRRLGDLLTDPRSLAAIEVAERFADGEVKRAALEAARAAANAAVSDLGQPEYKWEPDGWAANAVEMLVHGTAKIYFRLAANRAAEAIGQAGVRANAVEQQIQLGLLRDIFGNPFRPVSIDPAWLTSTVTQIAAGIYAERALDRLPILADALQDAGCEEEQVLGHCRGPGPHVRGCWVIDLLTGRV